MLRTRCWGRRAGKCCCPQHLLVSFPETSVWGKYQSMKREPVTDSLSIWTRLVKRKKPLNSGHVRVDWNVTNVTQTFKKAFEGNRETTG